MCGEERAIFQEYSTLSPISQPELGDGWFSNEISPIFPPENSIKRLCNDWVVRQSILAGVCGEMSVFHDTLFHDIFNLECQVTQPTRLGVGINYDEIRERCQQVTGQARSQTSGQDSGHIVNVDDRRHVRFNPEIKQKRSFRRKKSRAKSISDDSEILRTKMFKIRKNIPGKTWALLYLLNCFTENKSN